MRLICAFLVAAFLAAPTASADDAACENSAQPFWCVTWDSVEPNSGPSSLPSINYLLTTPPGTYPVTGPGWQVYATPPGVRQPPGPADFCGVTASQNDIPASCPAGWDRWFR